MSAKPPQKRKLWSDESMVGAIKSAEEGMSLRAASRMYNVPLETLRRRVNGSVDIGCKPGPPSVLSKEEEDALAHYVIEMVSMGFGLDVMSLAFEKSGKKHPFQNGMAGRGWFDGFRARHPKLTLRTPQPLSYCRALGANNEVIQEFFTRLDGGTYARLNLLSKPMLIYNMDETGVSVVHKVGKVVGYDVHDPNYLAWLRIHHPNSVCSGGGSNSSASIVVSASSNHNVHTPGVNINSLPCVGSARNPAATSSSDSSSKVLSEVLVLPVIDSNPTKRKRKAAINTGKTVMLTDTDVIEGLKQKEREKAEKEELKVAKQLEREEKRQHKREEKAAKELKRKEKQQERDQAKEQKKNAREQRKKDSQSTSEGKTKRVTRAQSEKTTISNFKALTLVDNEHSDISDSSDAESEAQCPKCGLVFGEDDSVWICCDSCNTWYDLKCASVDSEDVPDIYCCAACN